MTKDNLVYSTSLKGQNLSKRNRANSLVEILPESTTVKLQYEKKGRGGKGVTIVLGLPDNPPYFKRLMKEFKTCLATGGAYKEKEKDGQKTAQLEFQGNCIEKLLELLKNKGFIAKG